MAHTGGRMSYRDASIIKGLISAFHCYLFFFFLICSFSNCLYSEYSGGGLTLLAECSLSYCDTASQQFCICLQTSHWPHSPCQLIPRKLPAFPHFSVHHFCDSSEEAILTHHINGNLSAFCPTCTIYSLCS